MRKRPRISKHHALLENLEARILLSSTLRIVTYNMEADIDGVSTPRSGFYQVLEGIGEESVQANVRPIDILALEETTSNATTIDPIVTNLNAYYNGAALYAQSSYQATQDGGDTDGNGPNALVYNSLTLTLLASVGVGTPKGSTNGEYRQVVRYEFQPVGDSGAAGIFYLYVSHMKSGSTSADKTDRAEEATIIRNDEATLPDNSSVLYTGDLNADPTESGETEFNIFTAPGQGQAFDQTAFSTSLQFRTESATDLRYRDDYQLLTQNILDATGNINFVTGSFHVFGNNGTTPSGGTVNATSNTSLNSDLVPDGGAFISASTLYADLTTASDHLPVVADYSFDNTPPAVSITSPTSGSHTNGPTPTITGIAGIATGDSASVTLKIYSGASATGSPVQTLTAPVNPTSGAFSVTPAALPYGYYTLQASQSDAAGNIGLSTPDTVTVPIPGDINLDNTVDGADFDIWFTHLGTANPTWTDGDLNGDGRVDGADYDIWFTHLGLSLPPNTPNLNPNPNLNPSALLTTTASPSSPGIAIPGLTASLTPQQPIPTHQSPARRPHTHMTPSLLASNTFTQNPAPFLLLQPSLPNSAANILRLLS